MSIGVHGRCECVCVAGGERGLSVPVWVPEEIPGSSCGHWEGQGPEQSLSQPLGRLCQPGFPAPQWQPVPGPPAKDPPSSGMAPSRPRLTEQAKPGLKTSRRPAWLPGYLRRQPSAWAPQAGRAYENRGRGSSSDFRALLTLNRTTWRVCVYM